MKNVLCFFEKQLFCLFFCMLAFVQQSAIVVAQTNFIDAKIITLQKDTLQGYIDYQNWEIMPKSIQFKENLAQKKEKTYTAHQLHSFYVNDEIYSRRITQIDQSPYIIDDLVPNAAPILVIDTIFVQALAKGTASLYYMKDKNFKPHFFIETIDKFEELINRVELIEIIDGSDGIHNKQKYKKQLAFALSNCNNVNINFQNLSYTQKSLTKAFKKYNDCKGGGNQYYIKNPRVQYRLGSTVGLSMSQVNMIAQSTTAGNLLDLSTANFKPKTNISFGLRFDIILPRNRQKWRIVNEFLFRTYNISGDFEVQESPQIYRDGNININASYLGLNNLIRYQWQTQDFKPFFNVGWSNSIALTFENNKNVNSYYWGIEETSTKLALESIRKYEQAFLMGLGAEWQNLNLELRLMRGNGFSNYVLLGTRTHNYSLLFSYMF